MYFCIMNYIGTKGEYKIRNEVCRQLKIFLTPPVVYARRWSVCCSYSVWLCGLYHGALGVVKYSRALCARFSVCFSILIASLGEEGAVFCASCAFVCLFVLRVYVFVFFLILLVSKVGCGL